MEVRFPRPARASASTAWASTSTACWIKKGCVIDLEQRNTEVCIPFCVSSRGYGFLWNNPGVGRVELGTQRHALGGRGHAAASITTSSPATPRPKSWSTTPTPPATPPLLPELAAGFWQCKLRYRTQEELLAVAREYKRRGLPLSVIVSDFFHWHMMGDWRFDPRDWPDPAGDDARAEGDGRQADGLGLAHGQPEQPESTTRWPSAGCWRRPSTASRRTCPSPTPRPKGVSMAAYYDATNPEARALHLGAGQARTIYDHGMRVFWLDADEPELMPDAPREPALSPGQRAGGRPTSTRCCTSRASTRGCAPPGRSEIVTLCRSAWAGSQRYGAAVWSGDIPSTLRGAARAGARRAEHRP